ncbi:unnamed protein product, partial [Phaeothamnion confervicola]
MPITVLGGDIDPGVPAERLAGWQRHTRGACEVFVYSGGHFFLNSAQQHTTV